MLEATNLRVLEVENLSFWLPPSFAQLAGMLSAFMCYVNEKLETLSLRSKMVPQHSMPILYSALKNLQALQKLDLSSNGLVYSDLAYLVAGLEKLNHDCFKKLYLAENVFHFDRQP